MTCRRRCKRAFFKKKILVKYWLDDQDIDDIKEDQDVLILMDSKYKEFNHLDDDYDPNGQQPAKRPACGTHWTRIIWKDLYTRCSKRLSLG